tara:strand:+ start:2652 stop:4823 length:2172 start_codon:yes stop_codon:yes gene_type:complete
MNVNLEVKGTLAKLLATEDLVVEHRKVETAQFDVEKRVLTLPIWDVSNNIFDVLVAHEVGHALFTPNEDWTSKCSAPQQFVNVCEDVRIEKLMKDKYLGIAKSFYRGYNELHDMDFFDVEEEDIDKFNLADKINLYAKIGPFLGVKFTPQEQEIVNVVENAKTFEDTLAAAEALYNFCQQGQQKNESKDGKEEGDWMENIEDSSDGLESSGDSDTDGSGDSESPISGTNNDDTLEGGSDSSNPSSGIPNSPSVETMNSLEQKLKDTTQKETRYDGCTYIERPKYPLEKIILKNEIIYDDCEEYWDMVYAKPLNKSSVLDPIDKALIEYKRTAEKEVNYLVKEFECRKSASAYARAATSRTGVLDTTKLHTYKYNEDLFRKITVVPDGKNHGLIFYLDWSGSMHNCLGSTVKQLLNLVWFCRKVQIPFRVYGFSNCFFEVEEEPKTYWTRSSEDNLLGEPVKNQLWVDKSFRLFEFLTSEANTKEFDRQIKNFWRLANAMSRDLNNGFLDVPQRFHLSGTPLNLALNMLHDILPDFKHKYGLEKIQAIILTDGESESVSYASESENPYSLDRKLFKRDGRYNNLYLRDRKIGTTYKLSEYVAQTSAIVQNLQDNFPEVNFIAIRLSSNGEFNKLLRVWGRYTDSITFNDMESYTAQWRKHKSIALALGNFTKFFALSTNEMNKEVDFEVDEDATKSQIRSAFKKSLNKSKFNRKILSEFVELIS